MVENCIGDNLPLMEMYLWIFILSFYSLEFRRTRIKFREIIGILNYSTLFFISLLVSLLIPCDTCGFITWINSFHYIILCFQFHFFLWRKTIRAEKKRSINVVLWIQLENDGDKDYRKVSFYIALTLNAF